MTDETVRPSWPSAATPAEAPAPGPPPAPASAPAPPPAPPSSDSELSFLRRTVDLKLVIAVLIGLVSVTGAVVAWRSAQAGEFATDKDRQAVAETVAVAQTEANNEIVLQDARARFADHATAIVNAQLLDQQAEQMTAAGDTVRASVATEEAVEQRAAARSMLEGGTSPLLLDRYVTTAEDGRPQFDEGQFGDDLRQQSLDELQVNPSQTVREANRLREESERLDFWLIFLVSAIVVLTLAQVSRSRVLRVGLAGVGTAVWIVTSILAFTGS